MLPTRRYLIAFVAVALMLGVCPAVLADYEQGLNYFKAKKYVEAAAEFQALVDSSPEYDFGYYMLGMSFLKLKKLEDAEKNLRKALELNADKFEYHYGMANTLMQRRKFRDVASTLTEAEGLAEAANQRYALHSLRGFAYASDKKWSDAVDDLEQAKKIKAAQSVLVQLGKAYYALEYNDKAAQNFKAALSANPNDADTQRLLAEASIKLGKESRDAASKKRHYDAALTAADKARALNETPDTVNLVGKAALGAGQYGRAVEAFKKVIAMKPNHCYAMINLGKTFIAEERWVEAEKPLQDASKCSPREPAIYESLGLVYQKYGKADQEKNDFDKALSEYEKAKDYYRQAASIKRTSFIDQAIATIDTNIEVINQNREADQAMADQEAAIAEAKRLEEIERKKREEWEKRQQGGD